MPFFPIYRSCQCCNHDPFTMYHRDPFSNFHSQNTFSTPHFPSFPDFPQFPMMHHNMPRPPFGGGARADWEETATAHVLKVEIPAGLKKDDIDIKVEEFGKILKISGEKKIEKGERHGNWQHMERSSGKFMRTFSLPQNCKTDHVTSSFQNGFLIVTVPKKDVKNYSHVKNIQFY